MEMREAFLKVFRPGGGAERSGFERLTLFWMEDRHLRRVEKAEGWVRVAGLGGKILFEGFAFAITIVRVYGRDAHITVSVRPYVIGGRTPTVRLGRAESVLFVGLTRPQIENMITGGEDEPA